MFPGCPSKTVPDHNFAWMLILATGPYPPHPPGMQGSKLQGGGLPPVPSYPATSPPLQVLPEGARVPGHTSVPPCSLHIPAGYEHPKKRLLLPRLPVPRAGAEAADASKSSHAPSDDFRLAAVPAGVAAHHGNACVWGAAWQLPGLNFLTCV